MSPVIGLWLAALTVLAVGALTVACVLALQVSQMSEQLDAASDDSDKAIRTVNDLREQLDPASRDAAEAVRAVHLNATDPPSTGRHAPTS